MPERSGVARIREIHSDGGLGAVLRELLSYARWRVNPKRTSKPSWVTVEDWLEAFNDLRPDLLEVSEGIGFSIVCLIEGKSLDLLEQCVDSIVSQTFPIWELIVVPSDASADIDDRRLSAIVERDTRIRVASRQVGLQQGQGADTGVDAANLDYIVFADPGDVFHSSTLERVATCCPRADVIYTDEDKLTVAGEHFEPLFKPAWSPRLLLGTNYVNHLVAVRRSLLADIGSVEWSAQDAGQYDMLLRIAERDVTVAHIPFIACHRRVASGLGGAPSPSGDDVSLGLRVVQAALDRRGWTGHVAPIEGQPQASRVVFDPAPNRPMVKVIMPTRDAVDLLETAAAGLLERTDGVGVHLVIVDNGSQDAETRSYLDRVEQRQDVTVCRIDEGFNFSALCNAGAAVGPASPYMLFLNNDIDVVHPDWLQQLVGWLAADTEVVAVGPKLLFPDRTIQHAGVVLGFRGIAGHYALGEQNRYRSGTFHHLAREVSGLTAACLLVRSEDFDAVGGFDELLAVDFQDVDLCMRLRRDLGGVLVVDPTYPLIHSQSATRGSTEPPSEAAVSLMRSQWGDQLEAEDPYYSPHLSMTLYDLSLRTVSEDTSTLRLRAAPRWSDASSERGA